MGENEFQSDLTQCSTFCECELLELNNVQIRIIDQSYPDLFFIFAADIFNKLEFKELNEKQYGISIQNSA